MNNIKFNYLYRDGANYKSWGEIVFANPERLSLNVIEKRLNNGFISETLFIAHQISVPEKFLFLNDKFTKFDHCYHEFAGVGICNEEPTDNLDRSIAGFLENVELVSKYGWEAFDVLDRT